VLILYRWTPLGIPNLLSSVAAEAVDACKQDNKVPIENQKISDKHPNYFPTLYQQIASCKLLSEKETSTFKFRRI